MGSGPGDASSTSAMTEMGNAAGTSGPGATSGGLGLFLLFSGTAMALSGLTTALGKVVPAGVFLVAAVRFVVTGVYELSATSGWKHAAGLVGVVLFALAMYAGW